MPSDDLFCCKSIAPYRPQHLTQEAKFNSFLSWAKSIGGPVEMAKLQDVQSPFVVQLVRQVNFGPVESKRYFACIDQALKRFVEVPEEELRLSKLTKINTFKNYKCASHNRFFELNIYQPRTTAVQLGSARQEASIDL
eukprot:Blabericola_migrator_1__9396@NODE_5073_length_882_cov_216_202454_g3211_i0_p1_GENE_NODE_5073_length_882_cov_216_202454_g3211_i0NODE_5073_length_882_cov_216_202454_g3211_i0_p1_ORF_typecomplete_len149_score16_76_NODE_5073_length_882_cov_216_202454_g3211_i036449